MWAIGLCVNPYFLELLTAKPLPALAPLRATGCMQSMGWLMVVGWQVVVGCNLVPPTHDVSLVADGPVCSRDDNDADGHC